MNNERLEKLREIYKHRKLLEELNWGRYANHNRYYNKLDAEFMNWLCDKAYHVIKEKQNSVSMENIDKMIAELEKLKMTSGITNQSTWNECLHYCLKTVNEYCKGGYR